MPCADPPSSTHCSSPTEPTGLDHRDNTPLHPPAPTLQASCWCLRHRRHPNSAQDNLSQVILQELPAGGSLTP